MTLSSLLIVCQLLVDNGNDIMLITNASISPIGKSAAVTGRNNTIKTSEALYILKQMGGAVPTPPICLQKVQVNAMKCHAALKMTRFQPELRIDSTWPQRSCH